MKAELQLEQVASLSYVHKHPFALTRLWPIQSAQFVSYVCGRKPENLERSHADTGTASRLHTVVMQSRSPQTRLCGDHLTLATAQVAHCVANNFCNFSITSSSFIHNHPNLSYTLNFIDVEYDLYVEQLHQKLYKKSICVFQRVAEILSGTYSTDLRMSDEKVIMDIECFMTLICPNPSYEPNLHP